AASVQPFDDFLDTKCAGFSVTLQVQVENKANHFGFDRINVEFLLSLRPNDAKRTFHSLQRSHTVATQHFSVGSSVVALFSCSISSSHDTIDGKVEDVETPQTAARSPFSIRLVQRII